MKTTPALQTLIRIAAWTAIIALLVVTDGPISFRPITGLSANTERFAALFFIGGLFTLAYPRHLVLVLVGLLATVGGFEWLQAASLGRHAGLMDVFVKAAGACFGITAVAIGSRLCKR